MGKILASLVRVVDDANIATKLLVAPILAIIALALLFVTALVGFKAEEQGEARVNALNRDWIVPLTEARLNAEALQADLFRLTSFGLMGAEPKKLEAVALAIAQDEQNLRQLLRNPPGQAEAPFIRAELLSAYGDYCRISANAITNFLKNPGWGATTARNAAVLLDRVIQSTNQLRGFGIRKMFAEQRAVAHLHLCLRQNLGFVMLIGSLAVLVSNLFAGWRISVPLRKLTAAMARLAERHYEQAIPAILQKDEVGSMARAVQVFKDGMIRADAVTAEQQATRALLDTVLMNLPIPIVVKDAESLGYVLVNPAAADLQAAANRIANLPASQEMPPREAEMIAAGDHAALAAGGLSTERDLHFFVDTASPRILDLMRMVVPGADGRPRYLITVIQDFTERRRSEQRLAHMAQYDSLTDLPNRVLFAERLADALMTAKRESGRIAVLALDLDRFKEVNDTLGHAAGDMLLRIVTSRLRRCLRPGDTLARLGGDEFAVIQRGVCSQHDTEALATRLIVSAREPFDLDGQTVHVGLSAGCVLSDDRIEASELVQQADLALYEAKQAGRGVFRFFAPELSVRMHQRRQMEQDLRVALTRGQLSLHYQPCVSLRTGAIVGAEALMRWAHPVAGSVPASIFIPIAEETGLIAPLGLWLLDEACREAASWASPIRVAVNVSPVQFRTEGFVAHVRDALHRSGLAPSRLELEITEGVLMRDTADMLAILQALRDLGVRIALDDFGTGYSSLAYLQTFAFDKLKIDRSFVINMETEPAALAIMRAVLGMSASLNMTTTAEGIEEEAQANLLHIMGCNEAQGYFFYKPMPAPALRPILDKMAAPVRELLAG